MGNKLSKQKYSYIFHLSIIFLFTLSFAIQAVKSEDKIPPVETFSVEGLPISLIPENDELIFLAFWKTDLAEINNQIQKTIQLYKRFHDHGLHVYSIYIDSNEDDIFSLANRWQVPWPQIIAEDVTSLMDSLEIERFPSNVLVDSERTIIAKNANIERVHSLVAEELNLNLDDIPMPEFVTETPGVQPDFMMQGGMGMRPQMNSGGVLVYQEIIESNVSNIGTKQLREHSKECHQNLAKISIALEKYKQDHEGKLPFWLSDLYPKYVDDKSVLLCPLGSKQTNFRNLQDPNLPCNYLYEFAPVSYGDTTYRNWKTDQLNEYGDKVPVVRCNNHPVWQSLTYGGEIIFSEMIWENDLEKLDTNNPNIILRKYIRTIAVALDQYKSDYGEVPNQLQELYPKYIKDQTKLQNPFTNKPFSYEFYPLPFPESQHDKGKTKREWKFNQLKQFGGWVPIVRTNNAFDKSMHINLAYDGNIWESPPYWEDTLLHDRIQQESESHPLKIKRKVSVNIGKADQIILQKDWKDQETVGSSPLENESQLLPVRGEWEYAYEVLSQKSLSEIQTVLLFKHFISNGEIRIKAKVDMGNEGVRIIFGYKNSQDFYVWNIGGWNNQFTGIEKFDNVYEGYSVSLSERLPYEFPHNEWHTIRLEITNDDGTIVGYVDNNKIIEWKTDESIEGILGVGTWLTSAQFQDITIHSK